MRITFIAASLGDGGAERVVSELATEMHDQGHEVSVIVVGSANRSYAIAEGIRVIDCAKKYPVPGVGFLSRVADIKKAIRVLGSEVCISFNTTVNIYAALACAGLDCKLVLAERNDPRYYPSGKVHRILRKLLYGRADQFVFQTREAQSWFSEKIQRRSRIIFNPINRFLPEVHAGQRSMRVVTAARLEPQKNLKMALDAFEKLHREHPDYVFEIYGKGSLYGELVEYIGQKKVRRL
jgi:glycosyltransferase involved in cell wall biosynthesis